MEEVDERAEDFPGGDGLLLWWGSLVGHFFLPSSSVFLGFDQDQVVRTRGD